MANLYILVGNIASGKSTWVRRKQRKGAVVVSMDSIVTMVHGEYGFYDHALKPVHESVEIMMVRKGLEEGRDVYIDRTNMDRKRRMRFIALGRDAGARRIIVVRFQDVVPGELEARKQNSLIPVENWCAIWERMAMDYEPPHQGVEGYDEYMPLTDDCLHYQFHAFDFDGTIVEHQFPQIGKPNRSTIEKMNALWQDDQTRIIIWTCRSGEYLKEMRQWLIENNVPWDYINENPIVDYGSPKIFAHHYYDDRNGTI